MLNKLSINDDYTTPESAWESIIHIISKYKNIIDPFYCDGSSKEYLKELGIDIIHDDKDFYDRDYDNIDLVLSNPPFSDTKRILQRLKEIDIPFILIMPTSRLSSKYFREMYKDQIEILIPNSRINFVRTGSDKDKKSQCIFDCYYYCYKMNIGKQITYLE